MRSSYLDYAMSVIVGRALPDVRDGLKPVHRRVLFSMNELGLQPNRPYSKCAKVVGDVLGNYHPHGDAAIYDTLVRLAQNFSLRYPLVDGQGNFGNIDGYGAAAMRYTECRLAPLAVEMLRDIDEDTVDFVPNYDERHASRSVLPARFPNLLVNGSAGIAVGMATNIPPHNLGEIIDAAIELIDNPDATIDDLMEHVKGPDFPTGAQRSWASAGIRDAYETGRGRIACAPGAHRGAEGRPRRAHRHRAALPGQQGRRRRRHREDRRARAGQGDHRDPRHQRRVGPHGHADLHRAEARRDPEGRAQQALQAHRRCRRPSASTWSRWSTASRARSACRQMLGHYVDHQKEVVTRRTKFELDRAERRAHILEGYLIALDNLDAVIALIRGAADADTARARPHGAVRAQRGPGPGDPRPAPARADRPRAQARSRTSTPSCSSAIAELRAILADEAAAMALIKDELLEIRDRFADDRRTEIVPAEGEIDLEQLIAEEDMVISITQTGLRQAARALAPTASRSAAASA